MFETLDLQLATGTQMAIGVAILGAIAMLTLVLWWAFHRSEQDARAREERLSLVIGDTTTPAAPNPAAAKKIPLLERLASLVAGVMPAAFAARTSERLQRAGRPLQLEAADYLALRFLSTVLCALFAGALAWLLRLELTAVALVALGGALLGYAIPGIVLDRAIRTRQREIVRAMPAALDMLALSTAAGLTLDGAMSQVIQRWDTPLAYELRRYLAEAQMGRDRRTSLRAMSKRVDVQEVTRLTAAIIQADSLGLPISQVLREQANEMRRIRRQRAEEAARSAPVKMVFPLVLLIFPALFVVVLGPAVPRIMELFQSY